MAPIACPRDFLGYVRHADGRVRIRRRSVRRFATLEQRLAHHDVTDDFVRASLASWSGLAKHADAFRLTRAIFSRRDVRNIGKRLLVRGLGRGAGVRAFAYGPLHLHRRCRATIALRLVA